MHSYHYAASTPGAGFCSWLRLDLVELQHFFIREPDGTQKAAICHGGVQPQVTFDWFPVTVFLSVLPSETAADTGWELRRSLMPSLAPAKGFRRGNHLVTELLRIPSFMRTLEDIGQLVLSETVSSRDLDLAMAGSSTGILPRGLGRPKVPNHVALSEDLWPATSSRKIASSTPPAAKHMHQGRQLSLRLASGCVESAKLCADMVNIIVFTHCDVTFIERVDM